MEKSDAIRVIRVFLASPSDLGEERRAARAAVDEINRTVARPNGFHVDLIGWEDTLSTAGRPQAVINEDLESCEMFIGMLWERWGTPPDDAGRFSSGFEEEFSLATERHGQTGKPHMSLFFKDVEKSKLGDPGRELTKVLAFKQKIIDKREILFQPFSTTADLQGNVRMGIAAYIHSLDRTGVKHRAGIILSSTQDLDQKSDAEPSEEPWIGGGVEAVFVGEAAKTMASVPSGLSPVQIARLRLISMAAGDSRNDEEVVGAHDANLLFNAASELTLSPREVGALADAGVEAFTDENKPLWTWLAKNLGRFAPWLTYTATFGPDRRQAGAIRVLTSTGYSLVFDELVNAEKIEEAWFGNKVSAQVKNAALDYVAERGDATFVALAEREFERNDYATRKAALDAVILARGRESGRVAAQFAIASSFDALGDASMKVVIEGMRELDDHALNNALDSRSAAIRARAIALLNERRSIAEPTLTRLFEDPSAEVRIAAIAAFESSVRALEESEAETAFVRKQDRPTSGLLSLGLDLTADNAHRKWKRRKLAQLPFDELLESGPHALGLEDRVAALAIGHSRLIADALRVDVDDRFTSHWKRYSDIVRAKVGGGDAGDNVVKLIQSNEEFRRKGLVRVALDALEKLGDRNDLARVRKAIDDNACDLNSSDVEYLQRFGGWEDIRRIGLMTIGAHSALLSNSSHVTEGKVKAIMRLAGERVSDLIKSDLPYDLLGRVISALPNSRFKKLDDPQVDRLLHHESATVRKATALKSLAARNTGDVKRQLVRYLAANDKQYYNVIFWLDLAQAQRRESYRLIVNRELMRMHT